MAYPIITADEARKIADSTYQNDISLAMKTIDEAAKEGKSIAYINEPLTKKVIIELQQLGYDVIPRDPTNKDMAHIYHTIHW